MKLSVGKSAGFITAPDKKLAVYLLYGPDAGLVRARGAELARHFVADLNDPFAVADISADTLADETGRLADEMATIPMLGGWRLVRVKDAGDAAFAAVDHALNGAAPKQAAVILEAGDLDKRSKLRARVEDDANAMAIPCYAEEGMALDKTIQAIMRENGFAIDRDALSALTGMLPPDHLGVKMEVEKLILYAMHVEPKRITLQHVEAALADGSAEDVDEAIWAAASADLQKLDRQLTRLSAQGTAPVQLLRGMQRHLLRLYEAKAMMQDGKSSDEAMKSLRPPVFFKRENMMRQQLNRWQLPALNAALASLVNAEAQSKTTGMPAELVTERALYSLARISSGR